MKPESPIAASLVTLGLATAMHLDWHVARPAVHHLSLGWRWHWLLAVPVFAVLAWYVRRAWPDRPFGPSAVILIVAIFLAAVVEPAWEYWTGATFEWAFGRERVSVLGAFILAGVATGILVLRFLKAGG